mmetsp:Transcript_23969/g.66580  ORF Transcript_23969/g.66580 Transcript_23969/m.66580 type:complete len:187 (-) Transcript_23969:59-619(-)
MGESADTEGGTAVSKTLPGATFIEDVEKYVESKGGSSEAVIKELNSNYQNFKLVEQQLLQRRSRLLQKKPEIRKALDAVNVLIEKSAASQDILLDFELSDSVFTKARVRQPDSVKLWLGANVMLEYPLDEAQSLLQQNLENCIRNLETNQKDLDFVKDSVTTTEVSIARVYNRDIMMRKKDTEATD